MQKRKEIGSEFWDIPVRGKQNELFPENVRWFQSGRSALRAVIQAIKKKSVVRTVAVPSWCCDSMILPFLLEEISVRFYPVYREKGELIQEIPEDCDITLIMDFFGYSSNTEASHGIVIRDLTHSLFSNKHQDADYYFGSLRKWSGFRTGGFAFGEMITNPGGLEDSLYFSLREEAMKQKKAYINGESDDKSYLELFSKAEILLDECEVAGADIHEVEPAGRIDVEYIKKRRRENAGCLLEALSEYAIFPKIKENDCPMFVPVMVKKRDAVRRELIKEEIYCPVHWPISQYHNEGAMVDELYRNEISLVCDQRYTPEDMRRVIDTFRVAVEKC